MLKSLSHTPVKALQWLPFAFRINPLCLSRHMSSDPRLLLWSHFHLVPSSLPPSHVAFLLVCLLTKLGPASRPLPLQFPLSGMLLPTLYPVIIFTFRSELKYHYLTESHCENPMSCPRQPLTVTSSSFLHSTFHSQTLLSLYGLIVCLFHQNVNAKRIGILFTSCSLLYH